MHSQSYWVFSAYASQRTHFGLFYLMEIFLYCVPKQILLCSEKWMLVFTVSCITFLVELACFDVFLCSLVDCLRE